MKIITPPQIADLDELLDVVLHPEVFAKRLTELKDMRDSIMQVLDVYSTKEQADSYYEIAEVRLVELNNALSLAHDDEEKAQAAFQKTREQLAHDRQEWEAVKLSERQALDREHSELQSQANDYAQQRHLLTQQSAEVEALRVSLMQKRTSLDSEKLKIDQARKVLETLN